MGVRLEDTCISVCVCDRGCLLPTIKHGNMYIHHDMGSHVMADQVHPLMQTLFPVGDGIFQDDNAPIHVVGLVHSWFDKHEDEVKHLPLYIRSQYNITLMVYFKVLNTELISPMAAFLKLWGA
ncbi:DDE_3 domain-containing protein [Trichonephila clavipes]|nr:DDE_3 domain-containing protein [Trichonephila clavipes]